MIKLTLPRKEVDPEDVWTQETFNRAHAQLMSWQQGPGAFGDLHLHACWGESSVLSRRYHGQTVAGSGDGTGVSVASAFF